MRLEAFAAATAHRLRKLARLSILLLQETSQSSRENVVNALSGALGDDPLSRVTRARLLRRFGAQLGRRTTVRGSYFGGAKVKLVTGERCWISRHCYFDFAESVTLGNDVVVGHGVAFVTASHSIGESSRRAGDFRGYPILIENGVWIGANATILPGTTIGRGAIVAAGAVVTRNVPPDVIVAGVPARVLRELP